MEMCSVDDGEGKIIKSLYKNLWLSPECLNGEVNDVKSHQLNDVYSLGLNRSFFYDYLINKVHIYISKCIHKEGLHLDLKRQIFITRIFSVGC